MKGRSHRFQSHDPHDDWVDGSWTVDCVCGVNFDDGEEMVNCDDCGVWVHTRCSHYVKGEESFTCDKCKSKNFRNSQFEETEVAQLLVEMPNKTIRLEKGANSSCEVYKPWIPMENRVHVQGVPGGDPGFYKGLSSVFTRQLWKCIGYVPKKLNFQYREFDGWDDDKVDGHDERNENGADALFCLAKESVADLNGRCDVPDGGKMVTRKELEGEGAEIRHSKVGSKKEGRVLQPVVLHLEKRKRDDFVGSKDRSGKKQARLATEKELDAKKRSSHSSKPALAFTSDGKPLESNKDRCLKPIKDDNQNTELKSLKDSTMHEHKMDSCTGVENNVEWPSNSITLVQSSPAAMCSDPSLHILAVGAEEKDEKLANGVSAIVDSLTIADKLVCNVGAMPIKQEGNTTPNSDMRKNVKVSLGIDAKPPVDKPANCAAEGKGIQNNGDYDMFPSASLSGVIKEVDDDAGRKILDCRHSLGDTKDAGDSNNSGKSKINDTALRGSPSGHHEVQKVDKKEASDCHIDNVSGLKGDASLPGKEIRISVDSPQVQNEPKGLAEELSKSGGTVSSSTVLNSQPKLVIPSRNETSASANVMTSKPVTSDIRPEETMNSHSNSSIAMKDPATSDGDRDADRQETSRKTGKERSKPSTHSTSKASSGNKIPYTSSSKRILTDQKDSTVHSSLKASSVQNSCETSGLAFSDRASHRQSKPSASALPVRGEKANHSNIHSSAKANHLPSMNPPSSTSHATLSDEELALLLHQELNSSPRVPRVPRMRHAGSLPHLASPTAASMLIKRTSSSGGKDHSLSFRRKSRDTSRGGLRHSHESDDTKNDRVSSLPSQRGRNTGYASSMREENASSTAVPTSKRSIPHASTSNSGRSSSSDFNDHHFSYRRGSPKYVSDEDTGTGPVHRTLPGLINEIMGKGKRMTYEELCNAVLPHWHNLRKHNGERYAYASHSHAVLDCLRNRHEWAQLVDRGPKTSSSKKRRKIDDEEAEDYKYGKEGDSKSGEALKEEVPKGKRTRATKRRRLALQGRGIKDVRKRQEAEMISDDDSALFSNSSDESSYSEDETQADGTGTGGSETSGSSDEEGTL